MRTKCARARDEERPAVGAPLVGADLVALGFGEATPGGGLQCVDVELDLIAEEPVDGAPELEQLVDRLLPLVCAEPVGDLVDEQAVHPCVADLVDPVEAQQVAEQLVEVGTVLTCSV